ncbi:ATP-binding protein [Rhodocytophaga aerolata]|uniref:histidine kinase n=1 Tax=Rhodocytophaga aerolata TaxID=455078 RepID=A0ABT8RH87_9BACT|nr:ATP-binding protein [Rhodocytophaga aerolata]MDO1451471.1 ATP-binding protein [Rhodocytophaga aerolata]
MSIKLKLLAAFGFLFCVIMLLGGLGAYYLRELARDSKAIIKDNYESVEYASNMMKLLDELQSLQVYYFFNPENSLDTVKYQSLVNRFNKLLLAERQNITEIGEAGLAASLAEDFKDYLTIFEKGTGSLPDKNSYYFNHVLPAYEPVKTQVAQVAEMNMQAILRKNQTAQQTADRVVAYMGLLGTASMIAALGFLILLPGYIANPLKQLTFSIEEIANRNYDKRLEFDSNDEYGNLATAFNTMAARLHEYERSNVSKLLFEKKRIETIIQHMQDAIIGLDENKYILFANPTALAIIGMQEVELVGNYAPDVASVNDLVRNLIKELMIGRDSWEEAERRPLKIFANGKESFFSKEIVDVSSSKTPNGKPRLIGHLIVLKNITRFQELDAAKTNFIATISHELKTPISSIKMSAKLLEDSRIGKVNEEQQKLIAHIREDSQRLLKITGELMDLAQVETGNIQLHIRETDPKEIVDYACHAVAFVAGQKQIEMKLHIPPSIAAVQADREKTVWVMINLLSNAIRYSPQEGKIEVTVLKQKDCIEFSVKDFGKGIEEKYVERIFDKFFQVPESNENFTGTGLGLAISKEFIGAQGGRIWVESTVGTGSTFKFLLPIVKNIKSFIP